MRIYEAISKGVKKLKECNIDNPNLDSEILMSQVLKKDRKYLILNIKKTISKEERIYSNIYEQKNPSEIIVEAIYKLNPEIQKTF